jgi:hypothetical protein
MDHSELVGGYPSSSSSALSSPWPSAQLSRIENELWNVPEQPNETEPLTKEDALKILDHKYAQSTWVGRKGRRFMVQLLKLAEVDISRLGHDPTAEVIARYIRARQEERQGGATSNSGEDPFKLAITEEASDAPLERRKTSNGRGKSGKKDTQKSKKERLLKFGFKERIDTRRASAYLVAIEKQYQIDADYQSDQTSLDIGNPESTFYEHHTILQFEGKLVFTYHIQMMIRKLTSRHHL